MSLVIHRHFHYGDFTAEDSRMMMNLKETVVAYLRYYSGVFLEGLRKTEKCLNKDSRCSDLSSNRESPEYVFIMLPLGPRGNATVGAAHI